MNLLLLLIVPIGLCVQQIAKKVSSKSIGAFSFSAASAAISLLIYLATSGGDLRFRPELLGYSISFALCYSAALIGGFYAIQYGPLSLSSLIIQYSLIIPTLYGFIGLGDPLRGSRLVGIVLLMVSLWLTNRRGGEKAVISGKWIPSLILAFLGNGFCSTVQKIQQQHFQGQYKSEFMIIAIAISCGLLFLSARLKEKNRLWPGLKKCRWWILTAGLANGVVNFCTMILTNRLPASVMFPIISAGSTVLSSLVSIFLFKEVLNRRQYAGLILGILSLVVMNL